MSGMIVGTKAGRQVPRALQSPWEQLSVSANRRDGYIIVPPDKHYCAMLPVATCASCAWKQGSTLLAPGTRMFRSSSPGTQESVPSSIGRSYSRGAEGRKRGLPSAMENIRLGKSGLTVPEPLGHEQEHHRGLSIWADSKIGARAAWASALSQGSRAASLNSPKPHSAWLVPLQASSSQAVMRMATTGKCSVTRVAVTAGAWTSWAWS